MLPISPEAKPLWIDFHDKQSEEQTEFNGELSAAWAKLTGYAARLALVGEMAAWASGGDYEPPTGISATSMKAGITLARWFSAETKRIYAMLNESDDQRQVRELVDYLRQQNVAVTARHLTRGPRRFRGNTDLAQRELQKLFDLGLGRWVNQGTGEHGGRPTQAFQLIEQSPGDETPGDETPSKPEGNGGFVAVATRNECAMRRRKGRMWGGKKGMMTVFNSMHCHCNLLATATKPRKTPRKRGFRRQGMVPYWPETAGEAIGNSRHSEHSLFSLSDRNLKVTR